MTHPTPPFFTVVMPCHRASATIATAIASVLGQSERDWELIVVDDGCPAGSGDVARTAIAGDPRAQVIWQPNAGPGAARNYGAEHARGSVLAFLDADDRWTPDALARHRAHFERTPQLGVSFGRVRFFDPALDRPGRLSAFVPSVSVAAALAENPTCTTSNLVVRAGLFRLLGGFLPMTHAEDQDFLVRALALTDERVNGMDAEIVHYRTSPGGLSADLGAMERGWREMLGRIERHLDPARFAALEPEARALFNRYLARRALRTGAPGTLALRHFAAALRARPSALLGHQARRTLMTGAGVLAALSLPDRLSRPILAR